MEYTVYCFIGPTGEWKAHFMYEGKPFEIEGTETQQDKNRNEIQATLEVLQFLRNWVNEPASFIIYINSQYCLTLVEKWIPQWIQKGFRVGHTGRMRPHSDLLVKLHAFGTCMDFQLVQHYDEYETYHRILGNVPPQREASQPSEQVVGQIALA